MRTLRRIGGHSWLLPLTALCLRARLVRPSTAFALRELARVKTAHVYRLASNGLRVMIRHRTADPVTLGEIFHEHDYVPIPEVAPLLTAPRRILDLGGNVGLFGAFAAGQWPAARIEAFEPDPDNAAAHRQTIALNRLQERWSLTAAAAGASAGDLRFLAGEASLSRAAGDGDAGAITVPLIDVMDRIDDVDLLKMDIEGGEWQILGDPRFRAAPPRVTVLEYHPYLCPADDARAAAFEALEAAGLTVRELKRGPNGHGMLWAWRV